MTEPNTRASDGSVAFVSSISYAYKLSCGVAGHGMNRYHWLILILTMWLLHPCNFNIQPLPNVLLQLPHIDPFRPLGVIDKFRSYSPGLSRSCSKQVLFPGINVRHGPTAITFALKDVVKPGAVVIVVVEELGVEWYGTSVCGCVSKEVNK